MTYILGLDIGTTNSKALLFDLEGREILSSTRRTEVIYPGPPDWAQFDPDSVYQGVVQLIQDLVGRVDRPEAIGALAISSMGETGVPIDAEGRWLYPAIAWYDTRTAPQAQWWREHAGAKAVYAATGLPLSTSYGLLKLMWLRDNEPERYARCRRWLPIGDYVEYRLCNIERTDRTQAWRTMAFDISKMAWSEALLAEAGVSLSLMPEVVASGTPLGYINGEAAKATGLPPDCLVVTGGMDAICGMVAVGAIRPGIGLDIVGTSEMILTTLAELKLTEVGMAASLDVGPHAFDGGYLAFGSMTASGAIVEWFTRLVNGVEPEGGPSAIFGELTSEAEGWRGRDTPILVLPHFRGSRTPHSDVRSRGALVGLGLQTTRGQLFLGILEALCFESRQVSESLATIVGQPLTEMWVAGGAAENPLWMSLKADVMGHDIFVPESSNISAFGAAILAAYGAGFYRSLEDAITHMAIERRVVACDRSSVTKYHQCYRKAYVKLYASLREVNHTIVGRALC